MNQTKIQFTIILMFIGVCLLSLKVCSPRYATYTFTELNRPFEKVLIAPASDFPGFIMHLKLTGHINGNGRLKYAHYPFKEFHELPLEGKIEEDIKRDWYDKRCLIKFEPADTTVSGELVVEFIN